MKKVALLFIGSAFTSLAFAQTTTAIPLTESPQSRFTMGFNVGSSLNIYQLDNNNWPYLDAQYTDRLCDMLGAKFGIITEYKFSNHFSFSPKIELALASNSFDVNRSIYYLDKKRLSTNNVSIDIIGHVKLKAKKAYIIAGPSLKIPLIGGGDEYNFNVPGIDIGIGYERHFKSFIIAPELRYTAGIPTYLKHPSGNITYHNISLLINFSGL